MWRYNYTSSYIKVDLCAYTDSKNGIFTRRVYSAYILTRTPSPLFRRLTVGAAIEKIFFIFSDSVIVLVWFWLSDYRLIVSIFNISIFTRFGYAWLSSSTRLISLDIPCLFFVIFSSHQFRLVSALQILRFDSSTLYLFDSSAYYKQTSMLMIVWFMLILAILRLSDVFSFVLGVVYRLGIK